MSPARADIHAFKGYHQVTREQIIRNLRLHLPAEVRALRHFLVFKFTPPRKKGGKLNKIPYYGPERVRKHDHGTPEDRKGLMDFGAAIACYKEHVEFGGLGVAALPDSKVTYVDLDKCVDPDTGEINELAHELLQWGSYCELSPSGQGLRFIFGSNMHRDAKNNRAGIELFCHKGFVTLTGMPFGNLKPLVQLTAEQKQRLRDLVGIVHDDAPVDGEEPVSIPSPLTADRARDVRKALKHIDADCGYSDWILVGQALHSGSPNPGGLGFRTWLAWSQKGEKFADTSEDEMLRKWEGFAAGRGVTLASLFHLAKQNGYVPGAVARKIIEERRTQNREQLHVALDLTPVTGADIPELVLDPICPGLFDHVGAYLFIGRAKVGKSRVLGLMTAAAVAGGDCFGFKFAEPCRTLVIATEEDAAVVADRMKLYSVDPEDHGDMLQIIDRRLIVTQALRHKEDVDYLTWLRLVFEQVQPRFCYIDTLVGLRMLWNNDPEGRINSASSVTERDYQIYSEVERLAEAHGCVIVCTVHASKRKGSAAVGFDPFEQIGTTSWALAAGSGALVLMDRLGSNPFETEDDGQRIFSVRGRYRTGGDAHLVVQNQENGTIQCLGEYWLVARTLNEARLLEALEELSNGDPTVHVTAVQLAGQTGLSRRTVLATMAAMADRPMADGRRVQAQRGPGGGYSLAAAD